MLTEPLHQLTAQQLDRYERDLLNRIEDCKRQVRLIHEIRKGGVHEYVKEMEKNLWNVRLVGYRKTSDAYMKTVYEIRRLLNEKQAAYE